jgi:5-methylcytosine-specific restriction endonuclease McrA
MARFYDRRLWRDRIRPQYLAAHPLCEHCLRRGITRAAAHVDHIKPIEDGGAPTAEDNLQALCVQCHSRKTMIENGGKVRSLGCDVNGMPLDPAHPWNDG